MSRSVHCVLLLAAVPGLLKRASRDHEERDEVLVAQEALAAAISSTGHDAIDGHATTGHFVASAAHRVGK